MDFSFSLSFSTKLNGKNSHMNIHFVCKILNVISERQKSSRKAESECDTKMKMTGEAAKVIRRCIECCVYIYTHTIAWKDGERKKKSKKIMQQSVSLNKRSTNVGERKEKYYWMKWSKDWIAFDTMAEDGTTTKILFFFVRKMKPLKSNFQNPIEREPVRYCEYIEHATEMFFFLLPFEQ